ncbi:hypothetical protein, partial [Escherichia coli]|uniref:hypothetical protein n=1 Tax=Escherichia coli TaxID=562 RepID=UPI001BC89B8A
ADRNRSHWSTSKTPSYTKSVSWQHHLTLGGIGTATFGAILLNALLSRKLVDVPPPEVVHQEP